jgi:hypothetical protein
MSALGAAGTLAFLVPTAAQASAVHASAVSLVTTWKHDLGPAGANPGQTAVVYSSPMVATLDRGGLAAVFGDGAGDIFAYHLNNGSAVAGWPANTGAPVESTPSVSGSTIFVGTGNAYQPNVGGYEAYTANGQRAWLRTIGEIWGQTTPIAGVQSSLAVGNLQHGTDVVAGSLWQNQDALSASNGVPLAGFPIFQADTNFSTAALADLYRNGQTEIIEGGQASNGLAFGIQYHDGGLFRILRPTGQVSCQVNTYQAIDSSPAVGEIFSGGGVGIVAGTSGPLGFPGNELYAFNTHCGQVWVDHLDGYTESSPALVNALGNGGLQIAQGTDNGSTAGSVYLINGANGATIWHTAASGRVIGGIVSADLGHGYQDLMVPTSNGLDILDGRSGARLATLPGISLQNAPLVTGDPNGAIGITVAGLAVVGSTLESVVQHVEVVGSHGNVVNEHGAWPTFHHDPQLTGNAGTPPPITCSRPLNPHGYWLDASDGGIFTFGNLPFCGSTGDITLNKPIVGMAGTADAGGYWLVATDGGIFAFGDAHFYGSTGAIRLNRPIVGMTPTPDGRGYWLVASDGGIFAFGDAHFYGSTGAIRLNRPIVGMTPTRDGRGYWLVASDGGIFAFGDARFHGSTGGITLNQPVVAMSRTATGNGYWMVASDGGIFAFGDAHFYGSTAGITLNKPVVGMQTAPTGGYWLVATDGGIFAFHAPFYGSTGGIRLSQPIVGLAS